jgi:hypothetical protein
MESYPTELLLIAGAAMLAPILAELPKNIRIPVVVVEIFLGILNRATCLWTGKRYRHGYNNGEMGMVSVVLFSILASRLLGRLI